MISCKAIQLSGNIFFLYAFMWNNKEQTRNQTYFANPPVFFLHSGGTSQKKYENELMQFWRFLHIQDGCQFEELPFSRCRGISLMLCSANNIMNISWTCQLRYMNTIREIEFYLLYISQMNSRCMSSPCTVALIDWLVLNDLELPKFNLPCIQRLLILRVFFY